MSLRVVRKRKRLVSLPLLGGAAGGGLAGSFLAGAIAAAEAPKSQGIGSFALLLVTAFGAYLIGCLVLIYANAAIVAFAMAMFQGASPTIRESLRIVVKRGKPLLAWAAFAAAIGLAIRTGQTALPTLRYGFAVLGLGWTFLIPLVAPVVLYEGVGPLRALWRSGELRRRTWIETVGGLASLYGLTILAGSAALVPIAAGWSLGGGRGIEVGIAIAIAYLIPLLVIASTAKSVLIAVVYHYGTTGSIPSEFREPPTAAEVTT